jgi:endonuclease/exonuclease/phosphatase (EEP) superfamily protein YafD
MNADAASQGAVSRDNLRAARRRRRARRTARALSVLILTALLIRLTIRDRYPYLSLVFYAAPWPVLGALLSLTAVMWRRASHRWLAAIHGLAACAIIGALLYQTFLREPARQPHASASKPMRVIFWNVARTRVFRDRLGPEMLAQHPEVIALAEAGPSTDAQIQFWRDALPGWQHSDLRSGMLLCSRGPHHEEARWELGDGGRCRQFVVDRQGTSLRILLVDIKSNPLRSRREPLEAIARRVRTLEREPFIVLGDFNTPSDSVWFRPLREHCQDAFETAGRGYGPTWPVPLPALRLDHIWCGFRVVPISALHGWSVASDHRPIVADLQLTTGQ